MVKYQDLLQNSKAFSLIKRDIAEDMLSHSYMIVSEDNGALEEFYKLFLMAVFCKNNGCGTCNECRKVLNRNHADIIHIEKEKTIVVEDIKQIVENSYISSVEGYKKVFVIHGGEKMNTQAQNKLLKVLEEPPKDVIFLIGVTNISNILQTVKSRVKMINLDIFPPEKIFKELKKYTDDEEKAKVASICSEGQISKAVDLLYDDRYIALYKDVVNLLINLNHSSEIVNFIANDLFKKENISDTLDIMMLLFRDIAICKKDKSLVLSQHIINDIDFLSDKFSTASCIAIIGKIEKFKKMLYYNINSTNVAEQLMFAILEVKFRCN